jgi:S-adenosylmethionine hydrolase
MAGRPIITLTTDFGETDYFVGAIKGVILSIQPEAHIIDLSHHVKPQDLFDGAFLIGQAYKYFPPQTVHCVVVDPGVGTSRRPIVVAANNHFLIAPDNGVLSLIFDEAEDLRVIHATASHYFRKEVSQTFQGRDIFAPLAAWTSRGIPIESFGEIITDFVRLKSPKARIIESNKVQGAILKIDRFGNCITNIHPDLLPGFSSTPCPPFQFRIGSTTIRQILTSFAEAAGAEAFVFVGSTGFLEIGINRTSAAEVLKISRGQEVEVTW